MNLFPYLLIALFLNASLVMAQPQVGGGRLVTPDVTVEAQRQAQIAYGTDGYFVVWEGGLGGHSSIRAARLGQDGVSMDPSGLTLTNAPGGQFEPAVAWGHEHYMVVYSDLSSDDLSVMGILLDSKGVVQGDPFNLSTIPATSRMPAVAASSDGFIVAWAQAEPTDHGFYLAARRFSSDGQAMDSQPLPLTEMSAWSAGEDFEHKVTALADTQNIRIAIKDDLAVILWQGTSKREQGVHINRVFLSLTTGQEIFPADNAIPDAHSRIWHPEICVLGQHFLFVWTDYRDRGNLGLDDSNAGIMSDTGDAVFFSIAEDGGARKVVWPAVSSNGLMVFASTESDSHHPLLVRSLTENATSTGPDIEIGDEGAWPTMVMGSDSNSLLVYTRINSEEHNGLLTARIIIP